MPGSVGSYKSGPLAGGKDSRQPKQTLISIIGPCYAVTRLDCGVPKLHGHSALDQPRQLPERRGDLGGRRRRQLHLSVLDESRPPRSGVRCERGIENAMSIIENVPHCTRVFIRLGSDKTLIFVHLMANIIREKSLNQKSSQSSSP